MQYFDRANSELPDILGSNYVQERRLSFIELLRLGQDRRAQRRAPDPADLTFGSLETAFEQTFFGKCAFCEAKNPSLVHRFRPIADATPRSGIVDEHLYYFWLSDAWENLYPMCKECRPKGKASLHFPTKGPRCDLPTLDQVGDYVSRGNGVWGFSNSVENAIFLDPCQVEFFGNHISWQASGEAAPLTDEATATITQFKLNRSNLVQARRKALENFRDAKFDQEQLTGNFFQEIEYGGFLQALNGGVRGTADMSRKSVLVSGAKESEEGDVSGRNISSMRITNFKSLKGLNLDFPQCEGDVSQRMVLIGENATGKTSILEAIALSQMLEHDFKRLNLDTKTMAHNPSFSSPEATYRARPVVITTHYEDGSKSTCRLTKTGLNNSSSDCLNIYAYGAYRHFLNDQRKADTSSSVESLFVNGSSVSNPKSWLMGLDQDKFEMVVRALREIFEVDQDFDVFVRKPESDECLILRYSGENVLSRTPIELASSGFRSILAFACDMMRLMMAAEAFENFKSEQGLLLVDEIEAHLHPKWKIGLVDRISKAFPSMSIVATTHDPLCLRGLTPNEIRLLQNSAKISTDGYTLCNVEIFDMIGSSNLLGIDQLLVSDFFGLDTTDDRDYSLQISKIVDQIGDVSKSDIGASVAHPSLNELWQSLHFGTSEIEQIVLRALADYVATKDSKNIDVRRKLRHNAGIEIIEALKDL